MTLLTTTIALHYDATGTAKLSIFVGQTAGNV